MLEARALDSRAQPQRPSRKKSHGATRKAAVKAAPVRSFAWLNRLLILVGLGAVLAVSLKATLALQAIPVERIAVTGKLENTRRIALEEMVQPALAGGFLSADLQRIRGQLESLPWVYEATVKRQWPNALEIHVVEQLPIARWGEAAFLNHEGEIFHTAARGKWEALPMLTGPEGSEQELIGDYQLISEMLRPVNLRVEALTLDARGQLRSTLVGGTEVAFGDDDLLERLNRLVALYRASLAHSERGVAHVDLRYRSAVAVAFNTPPEVADT